MPTTGCFILCVPGVNIGCLSLSLPTLFFLRQGLSLILEPPDSTRLADQPAPKVIVSTSWVLGSHAHYRALVCLWVLGTELSLHVFRTNTLPTELFLQPLGLGTLS